MTSTAITTATATAITTVSTASTAARPVPGTTTRSAPRLAAPAYRASGSPVNARLQQEWEHLASRRSAVATANGWLVVPVRVETLDELLDASGFVRRNAAGTADRSTDDQANAVLARLLVVAASDELAARVVLQRLLPGLIALSGRFRQFPEMALDELVSVAWTVIRGFNHRRRRPRHIAATLLRDCQYEAYGKSRRRRMVSVPTAPSGFDELTGAARHGRGGQTGEPLHELLELVADGRRAGVVSDADLTTIAATLRGESPVTIATALKIAPRTLRVRRADLALRLRQLALASQAA